MPEGIKTIVTEDEGRGDGLEIATFCIQKDGKDT